MRVSLQIDGDAAGAQKAAADAASAIVDLDKQVDPISKSIEEGFTRGLKALEDMKNKSQGAAAANDNVSGSALGLADKLSKVAAQAAGADSALAKVSAGAVSTAQGFGGLVRSTSTIGLLGGALGLAVTVATTFFSVINSGSTEAAKRLDEQARLVGVVREAYSGAASAAGEFLTQSKAVTLFQAQQNLIGLQADLKNKATPLVRDSNFSAATPNFAEPFGTDFAAAAQKVSPFQKTIDDLHSSIAQGKPDIAAYQESIAAIGRAAQGSNPALAAQAAELLKNSKEAGDTAVAVRKTEATIAMMNGTATVAQRKLLGISTAADDNTHAFERMTKAMERQAAAQEADAQTAGVSAGEAARLRAQFVLNEAAQQSGIKVAGEYADKIKDISDRAGEAAGALAKARIDDQVKFERGTAFLTPEDKQIAEQVRTLYGTDIPAALNSSEAAALRASGAMRQIGEFGQNLGRDSAVGFAQEYRQAQRGILEAEKQINDARADGHALTDAQIAKLRREAREAADVWHVMGNAATKALDRISDKLVSMAADGLWKAAFGGVGNGSSNWLGSLLGVGGGTGTVGNGGIVLGSPAGPGVFAAAGGGTFGLGWGVVGERGAEIIKVHAGGVTVYPHEVSKPYLPGFADGGSLSPWGMVSRLPAGRQDNAPAGGAQAVHVTVGVSVDDDGKIKAYVKNISAQTMTDGISGYAASPAFVQHVADASNAAKTYRML